MLIAQSIPYDYKEGSVVCNSAKISQTSVSSTTCVVLWTLATKCLLRYSQTEIRHRNTALAY